MQDIAKREFSRKVLKVDTAGGQIRRKENTVFFHCTASYLNVKGFSVKERKLLSNGGGILNYFVLGTSSSVNLHMALRYAKIRVDVRTHVDQSQTQFPPPSVSC